MKIDPIQTALTIVPAGEFKAKCLRLMDEAVLSQKPFVITKRGKPVGRFVPEPTGQEQPFRSLVGSARGIKIVGDIVSPLPQEWTLPKWAWEKPAKSNKKARRK